MLNKDEGQCPRHHGSLRTSDMPLDVTQPLSYPDTWTLENMRAGTADMPVCHGQILFALFGA